METFTPEYLQHLKNIKKAQKEFDNNKNSHTATELSNLKNNMFKDAEEVFTQEYIDKVVKRKKKIMKEIDKVLGDYELEIVYGPGLYNHVAESLKVIPIKS